MILDEGRGSNRNARYDEARGVMQLKASPRTPHFLISKCTAFSSMLADYVPVIPNQSNTALSCTGTVCPTP